MSLIITNFRNMIKTQFGVKIKYFGINNACNYFNQTISSILGSEHIIYDSSCFYTP